MGGNTRTVEKISTSTSLIEFLDQMAVNEYKYNKVDSSVHSRLSKIKVQGVDYSTSQTVSAEHNLDANLIKSVAQAVLTGQKFFFSQPNHPNPIFKSRVGIFDIKTDMRTKDKVRRASSIHIYYVVQSNTPHYVVEVASGKAEVKVHDRGWFDVVKYQPEKKVKITISEFRFYTLCNTLRDYISQFETVYNNKMRKNRFEFEKEVRKKQAELKTAK